MENESMIFYKSFYEAIRGLQTSIKAELYDAIVHYGLYEEDLQLSDKAMPYYILIKPQLVANLKRRKAGAKGKEFGKLGGRPKNPLGDTEENPIGDTNKNPLGDTKQKPLKTPNNNVNVNVNIKKNIKRKNPFTNYPESKTDYEGMSNKIYAN